MPVQYTAQNAKKLLRGCDEASVNKKAMQEVSTLSDKAWKRRAKRQKSAKKYGIFASHGKPLRGGLCG